MTVLPSSTVGTGSPTAGRVLVTGATGFLGLPLVARLAAGGARVTALARSPDGADLPAGVERIAVDLASGDAQAALSPWRWDAVVNLAGPVPKKLEAFEEGAATAAAHVHIALHLLGALPPGFSGRVIHTSSMTVYGLPASIPVAEGAPRRPTHPYALGKWLADSVLLAGAQAGFLAGEPAGALDLWILRLPGLFAPWRRGGALHHFARAAVRGEPLRVTGSEPFAWDILDVRDAVEAIVRALASDQRGPGEINVSYGEPVEIVAMARRIAAMAGRGSVVLPAENVIHPVFQQDITRARALLAWPPASLDDRLTELLAAAEAP